MTKKIRAYIQKVLERNRFITHYKSTFGLQSRIYMQVLVSCAFFVLTIVNLLSKSYIMLALTGTGCFLNFLFAIIAKKRNNGRISAISSIITCSVLFGYFIVIGGNDGFACLWIALVPLLAMVSMDFVFGFFTGVFFQLFLIVVFWTPMQNILLYPYSVEFCKRFPLFFLVSFLLGLFLTLSLQKSEYNEYKNYSKLMEITAKNSALARIDPLTQLSNRRFAYEEFESKYSAENTPHCIVMGDIDSFKTVNDRYGHEFGDDVLVGVAKCINESLPDDYLKSRWGGEEFLLAANAPIDEVFMQIENLRKTIAEHIFDFNGTPVQITITFGIAEYFGKSELNKAISIADKRLFNGKINNKNRTVTEGL